MCLYKEQHCIDLNESLAYKREYKMRNMQSEVSCRNVDETKQKTIAKC
jgi:hypothetical protein